MYQSETDSWMQLCHWSGEYMRVAPINIVDTLFHSALSVERSYEFDTYKFSSLRALGRILLYIYNLVIVHTLTLTHRLTHSFTHSLDLFHSIFYSNLWVCFSFVSVFIIIQCFLFHPLDIFHSIRFASISKKRKQRISVFVFGERATKKRQRKKANEIEEKQCVWTNIKGDVEMECAWKCFRDLEFNVLKVDFIEESKSRDKKGGWFSHSDLKVLTHIKWCNGKHPHYHIVSLSIQFTVCDFDQWNLMWTIKFSRIDYVIKFKFVCMDDISPKIYSFDWWMVKVLSKNQRCDL